MKIYFAGSIRAGRGDAELYARLVDELKTHGTVLTEHVGSDKMLAEGAFCDNPLKHWAADWGHKVPMKCLIYSCAEQ